MQVRDSKDQGGPLLYFLSFTWCAFVLFVVSCRITIAANGWISA